MTFYCFFSESIDTIRNLCSAVKFFMSLKKAKFEIKAKKTVNHFIQKFRSNNKDVNAITICIVEKLILVHFCSFVNIIFFKD